MLQRTVFVVVVATVSTRVWFPFVFLVPPVVTTILSRPHALTVVDAPVVKRRDFAEGIGW